MQRNFNEGNKFTTMDALLRHCESEIDFVDELDNDTPVEDGAEFQEWEDSLTIDEQYFVDFDLPRYGWALHNDALWT